MVAVFLQINPAIDEVHLTAVAAAHHNAETVRRRGIQRRGNAVQIKVSDHFFVLDIEYVDVAIILLRNQQSTGAAIMMVMIMLIVNRIPLDDGSAAPSTGGERQCRKQYCGVCRRLDG
jgi:hypothetical protein